MVEYRKQVATAHGKLRVDITPRTSTGSVVRIEGPAACGKSVTRRAMEDALRHRGCTIEFSDQMKTRNGEWLPVDLLIVADANPSTVLDVFRTAGMSALRDAHLLQTRKES